MAGRHLPKILMMTAGLVFLTTPAQAIYLFYMRKDLDRAIRENPEEVVGEQVTVTDQLAVVWPIAQERPAQIGAERYVVFDTVYFHCAVPQSQAGEHLQSIWEDARQGYGEVLGQLEKVNDDLQERSIGAAEAQEERRKLWWELYRVWSNRPIVTLFGTAERADFWGPVVGKDAGVGTERVTIVCERVEKPRERWYEYGLDDQ